MIFNELYEEFLKMCDPQRCVNCKYNGKVPCQLVYGYGKGRVDAIDEFVDSVGKLVAYSYKTLNYSDVERVAEQLKENGL